MAIVQENIEVCWKHLKSKSINDVAAAAMLGNVMQESTFNIYADNGTHHGLCQWDKEYRWPRFVNEFKGQEDSITSQIDYALWELTNIDSYSSMWKQIGTYTQATDVAAATEEYEASFEVSGGSALEERKRYAIAIYDHFVNNKPFNDDFMGEVPAGSRAVGSTTAMGKTAPSDSGVKVSKVSKKKTPKVYDINKVQKLAQGKTYCAPVYPDIVSVYNQIPEWALQSNLDKNTADDKTIKDAKEVKPASEKQEEVSQSIPRYAYEAQNNDKGCFDVGLPLGSIAAYGSDSAKYQINRVQSIAQRQIQFDPTKHDNAVKLPTPGMVPNNKDAFPVDLRIRDLELHMPRIVKENIKATEFETETAKALLETASDTEKRMVQVENHLSTISRYLFRLASIVPINDMYYGGNTMYEKYASIRQLTDDRVTDGMQTQVDQYMTSTRLEPIIGQTYEILNQVGANLSVLLDDNQLSYSNMKHYCDLIDIKRYQEPLRLANINEGASLTKSNNQSEKLLNEQWPDGFKMDWKLVPVEEQVPIINWRQSIIDDGSALMNSSSMYGNGYAAGSSLFGNTNNIFYRTAQELEKLSQATNNDKDKDKTIPTFTKFYNDAKNNIQRYKDQAKNIAKSKETYMQMKKEVESAQLHKDFTAVVIAAIMCILDVGDYKDVLSKLKIATKKLKDESLIDNPLLVALAYFTGTDSNIAGDKPTKDPTIINSTKHEHEDLKTRLDFVYGLVDNSGGDNGNGQSKIYFGLDIKNQAEWKLQTFASPYTINQTKKRELPVTPSNDFARLVELCVCFKEIANEFYASEFDNDKWGFFFPAECISQMKLTGFPGEQRSSHVHQGMDVVYELDDPKPQILSICDGTVVDTGWGYNAVMINAANGTNKTIVYMHMSQIFVQPGNTVQRGQPIGIIGGVGPNGPDSYPEHLHIESWTQPNREGNYESIGNLYPGVFQDMCDAYIKQGSGELRYADFKK